MVTSGRVIFLCGACVTLVALVTVFNSWSRVKPSVRLLYFLQPADQRPPDNDSEANLLLQSWRAPCEWADNQLASSEFLKWTEEHSALSSGSRQQLALLSPQDIRLSPIHEGMLRMEVGTPDRALNEALCDSASPYLKSVVTGQALAWLASSTRQEQKERIDQNLLDLETKMIKSSQGQMPAGPLTSERYRSALIQSAALQRESLLLQQSAWLVQPEIISLAPDR